MACGFSPPEQGKHRPGSKKVTQDLPKPCKSVTLLYKGHGIYPPCPIWILKKMPSIVSLKGAVAWADFHPPKRQPQKLLNMKCKAKKCILRRSSAYFDQAVPGYWYRQNPSSVLQKDSYRSSPTPVSSRYRSLL